MPEALDPRLVVAEGTGAFDDAQYLAHKVSVMAGRLAQLLGHAPMVREDPVAAGVTFLRSVASGAGANAGRSAMPREPRLERLAAAHALTPLEVDLLVLAGMAEEHEGFGSLFRTLHPRREPRPTTGLAAQILCDSP